MQWPLVVETMAGKARDFKNGESLSVQNGGKVYGPYPVHDQQLQTLCFSLCDLSTKLDFVGSPT